MTMMLFRKKKVVAPPPVRSASDLGDAARDRRDWPEAARQYRLHLQTKPEDFAIWVQCGHAEKESGDLVAAERCYRTAEALRPDDVDLQLQIGHLQKLMRRFSDAALSYRRALHLAPNLADAKRELAQPSIAAALAELDARSDVASGPAAGLPLEAPAVPPELIDQETEFDDPSITAPLLDGLADIVISAEDWDDDERLLALAAEARALGRHGTAAVLIRALVVRAPTQPQRWEDLAKALEDTGDKVQAQRCREVAASLEPGSIVREAT